MKVFKTKKLSTALLLPIILTVFAALIVLTFIDVVTQKNQMTDDLNHEAERILTMTADATEEAFWTYNDVSLNKIGETLASYQEVAAITMVDAENQVVFETSKDSEPYQSKHLFPAFTQEIYKYDQKIGEIKLVFTNYYLTQAIFFATFLGFIRTIIISIIIVVMILFLSRNLSESIDEIAVGVKRFSEGDTKIRIQVKDSHEVKNLADRINKLFDDIQESRSKLTENYKKLEKQEEALRISEERYRYAVEGSNDAIWDWDLQSNEFYVSQRGLQMIGVLEQSSISLEAWKCYIHSQDQSHFENYLQGFYRNETNFAQIEFRVIGSKGETRWLFCRGKGILDHNNELIRVSGFYTDITDRINAEEAIQRLAYYDVLTGLPNRAMLFEQSDQLFAEPERADKSGALLYIDLDNFKAINDTKGHTIGDHVLVNIARELVEAIRCDTIARIGGDELVVIDKDCTMMEASKLANEIMGIISKPWNIEGFEFNITCSIGITMFPEDGTDINKLLMNADSAMYHAKEQGKDQFRFFDHSTNEMMVRKIELQYEIRRGIANREFVLYYQPQVDFATGLICGVEALVRWQHPTRGLLLPFEFIGLAEESGLIVPLGEQILMAACEQSVAWEKAGYENLAMAVNFSAKQINQKDIIEVIFEILDKTGMRPELLDIEITESIAMENLGNTLSIINKIKNHGIKFSLDDFGTGYSSLNYLHKLPIDHLKIDKQFVQDMRPGSFEEVVIKATIEIAHRMNLIVIAEGIETKDQFEAILAFKGDRAQGYLYSKPVPAQDLEILLNIDLNPAKRSDDEIN
ncbi:EAL domain-containing protein [Acetobacterium sp.]|uniref:EAL domain-containing protein n=1 Tax=Acetobacterium sp. TaxID=1872094 RepID=UPI003593B43F